MRQARSRYRLLAIRVSCRSQLTFSATAEERASMWKKSTPVLDVVLDQHPLGVAADEVGGGPGQLVGQQQGRILVPQLGDGQLAEGAGLTHQPGMSERSGKERLACIVPSGWLGIGHRLYHRAPGSFDLFRDVPTMTAIPEPTAAFPTQDSASILDHFAGLSDPRREQGRIHRLDEIVFMATCAVFCGADTWEQIAGYAHSKIDWLRTFLTLPGGVPSHDTFRRVFCLLDPVAFQKCFYAWMTALMERRGLTPLAANPPELTPIAIDGKAQRGSARRTVGQSALHIVSAWAVENHLTLGQVATDAKSNEITAIPELLELLDLEGAVVTIDAMGCQKEIAADIVGEGGQYVLAVKENQPHLYEDIERAFDEVLERGEAGVDFTECQ